MPYFSIKKKDGVMRRTSIGGEALIEGIMMRGPRSHASAYRQSDGSILIERNDYIPFGKRYKILGIPLIRGIVGIIESLVIGIKALMHSADFIEIDDEEPSRFDLFIEKLFGDKIKDFAIYFALIIAVVMGIALFMLFPNFAAGLINLAGVESNVLLNVFEGLIRLVTFFSYIVLISKMKDIKRVFEYHGAEHKTIHAYENEEDLTIDNVKKHSTRHPRCGTAFLFLVMAVSIIVFSFAGWHSIIINILFRLMLIPLVAGISYELLKAAGKSDNQLVKILSYPGILMQKFTTREPDDQQIEIAIAALKRVLEDIKEGEDSVN